MIEPEAFARHAAAYVDALLDEGFTRDQAVRLAAAWAPSPVATKAKPKAPRPAKPSDDELPEGFPRQLVPFVEPVLAVLDGVAAGNGAEGVLRPTRRAVALALLDFPDRDFLPVAQEYRAWQLGGKVRSPHRDIVRGYRAQLRRSRPVARPTSPTRQAGPDRREVQRARLEEAEA